MSILCLSISLLCSKSRRNSSQLFDEVYIDEYNFWRSHGKLNVEKSALLPHNLVRHRRKRIEFLQPDTLSKLNQTQPILNLINITAATWFRRPDETSFSWILAGHSNEFCTNTFPNMTCQRDQLSELMYCQTRCHFRLLLHNPYLQILLIVIAIMIFILAMRCAIFVFCLRSTTKQQQYETSCKVIKYETNHDESNLLTLPKNNHQNGNLTKHDFDDKSNQIETL